jgi:hypothetical protein
MTDENDVVKNETPGSPNIIAEVLNGLTTLENLEALKMSKHDCQERKGQMLKEKLHPSRFTDMSPKMAAIIGYEVCLSWVAKRSSVTPMIYNKTSPIC